jgi:hypothetical protein
MGRHSGRVSTAGHEHADSEAMSNWTEEERAEALKRRLQGKGVMDEDAAAALGGGLR